MITTGWRRIGGVATRISPVGTLVLVAALSLGSTAQAATQSGNEIYNRPVSPDYGAVTWNQPAGPYVRLDTWMKGTIGTNYCLDSWFDWHRAFGGHYDARLTRACRSAQRVNPSQWNEFTGYYIDGLNKWGVCYGQNPKENSPLSNCVGSLNNIGSMSAFNPSIPNKSTDAWVVWANGNGIPVHYSGGIVDDPNN